MTDPFPRLADALVEVSSRLQDIGAELRSLQPAAPQTASQAMPQPQPAPRPVPRPVQTPVYAAPPPVWAPPRHAGPPPPQRQPLPPYPPPPVTAPGPTLWERLSREGFGARVLAWAGGVITLAGVVLMLVLAIQRGYIGPVPRLLLGGALGLALVGIGLRVHSAASAIGAHAVAATGVAIGYLDVVATTSYYHFVPPWAGLVIGLAVAGGGLAIANLWRSEPFAMFVVLACALSAPVLTRGATAALVGFLLVLQLAATPTQLLRGWSRLTVASGVPPVLAVLAQYAVAQDHARGHAHSVSIAALCVATAAVQLVVAAESVRRRGGELLPIGLVVAAPVPALIAAPIAGRAAGALLLAGLVVLSAAVWAGHRFGLVTLNATFADAAGAVAALAALESLGLALDGDARALALLAAAALFALLAVRLDQQRVLVPSMLFGVIGLGLAIEHAVRPDRLTDAVLAPHARGQVATMGTTGLLLAVTALVVAWGWGRLDSSDADTTRARWIAAAVLALYGASAAVLSLGLAISPDEEGFRAGQVAVTVSWTLAALVLLLRHIDSTPLRVAGLSLVGAALAKLVLFDLASLSGIPRVTAFLGAGLVLLAAGTRYAKLVAARTGTGQLP